MKKITAFVAAAVLVSSVSAALAGGPVIVAQEPVPVVAAAPVSSVGAWVPLLVIGVVAVAAVASSGNH